MLIPAASPMSSLSRTQAPPRRPTASARVSSSSTRPTAARPPPPPASPPSSPTSRTPHLPLLAPLHQQFREYRRQHPALHHRLHDRRHVHFNLDDHPRERECGDRHLDSRFPAFYPECRQLRRECDLHTLQRLAGTDLEHHRSHHPGHALAHLRHVHELL